MTGMRFQISVAGDVQLDRALLNMKQRVSDLKPVFKDVHEYLEDVERKQFKSQGVAKKWERLAASTVQRKGHSKILRDTDRLYESLGHTNSDSIRIATKNTLEFGTKVPYAGFHQTGTNRMPQRRPIDFTERQRKTVVRMIQHYMVTGKLEVL